VRIVSHGPFVPVADIAARIAATPGSLGDLYRRVALELGVLAPPPGTRRVERELVLPYTPRSFNENEVRSHWKGFHEAKTALQDDLVVALHRLEPELPRPIVSVDHDGEPAPVWLHVVLRFPTRRGRDVADNFWMLIAKALGDALTGLPAKDRAREVNRRRYVCGWLVNDGAADRLLFVEIDPNLGPPQTTVRLVWDEPA
jgi:hypothetical protein